MLAADRLIVTRMRFAYICVRRAVARVRLSPVAITEFLMLLLCTAIEVSL